MNSILKVTVTGFSMDFATFYILFLRPGYFI